MGLADFGDAKPYELTSSVQQRAQHCTVFFITHDVDEAVFLRDRVPVMSARPGRVVLDQDVTLSAQAGRVLGEEMRRLPEFIELREKVAGAIEH